MKIIEDLELTPARIFNVDETGLQIVTGKNPKVTTLTGDKDVFVKKSGERSETISVAACGNAAGTTILSPFIIFKGASLPCDLNFESYPAMTQFSLSKSGYMTSETFTGWFEMFLQYVPTDEPVLLVLDGHASHLNEEVLRKARERKVHLFFLPPHTTHLYQPLDVVVFSSLKSSFRHEVNRLQQKCKTKKLK
jgi:transposase